MFNRKFSIKSCICVNFRLTHQHTTTQIWLKKKKKIAYRNSRSKHKIQVQEKCVLLKRS